jgi:hypothetical protein
VHTNQGTAVARQQQQCMHECAFKVGCRLHQMLEMAQVSNANKRAGVVMGQTNTTQTEERRM